MHYSPYLLDVEDSERDICWSHLVDASAWRFALKLLEHLQGLGLQVWNRGFREQWQAGDESVLMKLRSLRIRQAADGGAQRKAVRFGDDFRDGVFREQRRRQSRTRGARRQLSGRRSSLQVSRDAMQHTHRIARSLEDPTARARARGAAGRCERAKTMLAPAMLMGHNQSLIDTAHNLNEVTHLIYCLTFVWLVYIRHLFRWLSMSEYALMRS